MGTHETQQKPKEVAMDLAEYGVHGSCLCQILVGPHRDRRYVLNMDQMPTWFSMLKKRTLEVVGVKTVHIRT